MKWSTTGADENNLLTLEFTGIIDTPRIFAYPIAAQNLLFLIPFTATIIVMTRYSKQRPTTVEIDRKKLVCPICGNSEFRMRKILLNTMAATLFDLDWTNRKATCYICYRCTNMIWFHGK